MRRSLLGLAAIALLAVAATAISAHDLFIKLDSYFVPPGTAIRVPIINGTFELSENSITADRVTDVSIFNEGGLRGIRQEDWDADGDTTFLALRTGDPGTYVLGISTLPRSLALAATDFNEYLAHDGIPDVLAQRERDGELERDVVEQYSKHVKAVFQVGEARTGGLDRVLGHPAELIPVGNPYDHAPGDEFAFRALVDGDPVAGQLVLAGGQGAHGPFEERSARTDARGEVRFGIDEPGRWYIKFINMKKTTLEGVDYESKWATLTFEVR
ncbi:MAG: DUF4198 domain-containing protein [Gemmatimonadota bacterium]|jgi:uncharacterized GH25 family protein